jgi:hypothetical protein
METTGLHTKTSSWADAEASLFFAFIFVRMIFGLLVRSVTHRA